MVESRWGAHAQFELDDGQGQAGMTLEDAGEDQIARQRRIEGLRRAAAGGAQRLGRRAARRAFRPAISRRG
jgi:hypothetical protein